MLTFGDGALDALVAAHQTIGPLWRIRVTARGMEQEVAFVGAERDGLTYREVTTDQVVLKRTKTLPWTDVESVHVH